MNTRKQRKPNNKNGGGQRSSKQFSYQFNLSSYSQLTTTNLSIIIHPIALNKGKETAATYPRKNSKGKTKNGNHGYVDCCRGVWRIQGSLAITRRIGDRHLKQFVITEQETKVLRIDTDCEFFILASDGLWDKVNFQIFIADNQEAIDPVRASCVGVDQPEPSNACKKLVELAIKRCSMDDISVKIIQSGRFRS
ncbi:probable protein phosphatase 2C 30 [Mercurialis annua]|uniref:probable protein phosphatase 2C 30 n=1 Tax=Mercurialis annua TaxID=3986 RepID=UPI00215E84D7|nr:probable protein phosphatase 2C 30 [Mercurialis annua]